MNYSYRFTTQVSISLIKLDWMFIIPTRETKTQKKVSIESYESFWKSTIADNCFQKVHQSFNDLWNNDWSKFYTFTSVDHDCNFFNPLSVKWNTLTRLRTPFCQKQAANLQNFGSLILQPNLKNVSLDIGHFTIV